jgi:hypothetical protein
LRSIGTSSRAKSVTGTPCSFSIATRVASMRRARSSLLFVIAAALPQIMTLPSRAMTIIAHVEHPGSSRGAA